MWLLCVTLPFPLLGVALQVLSTLLGASVIFRVDLCQDSWVLSLAQGGEWGSSDENKALVPVLPSTLGKFSPSPPRKWQNNFCLQIAKLNRSSGFDALWLEGTVQP